MHSSADGIECNPRALGIASWKDASHVHVFMSVVSATGHGISIVLIALSQHLTEVCAGAEVEDT